MTFDDFLEYDYRIVQAGGCESLTLPNKDFPRSITRHEFNWLRRKASRYNQALEIATGTGVSSVAIRIPTITIDCYIEEFSGRCDNYKSQLP